MVWSTVTRPARWVGRRAQDAGSWLGDRLDRTRTGFQEVDPDGRISDMADDARQFGMQGQEGFAQTGQRMGGLADMLEARARGEDSLSAEQLRQGLGQALSQQQAAAASARPGQGAMAARTAMNQMGQQASGMAGQQAMAGIQERAAAQGQLQGLLGQQRQQDLQAALGARGQALGAMGTIEGQRGMRHQVGASQPTPFEHFLGGAQGALSLGLMGGGGGGGGAAVSPLSAAGMDVFGGPSPVPQGGLYGEPPPPPRGGRR